MDTLNFISTDATYQAFAVILQGVFLIVGAIFTIFKGKK